MAVSEKKKILRGVNSLKELTPWHDKILMQNGMDPFFSRKLMLISKIIIDFDDREVIEVQYHWKSCNIYFLSKFPENRNWTNKTKQKLKKCLNDLPRDPLNVVVDFVVNKLAYHCPMYAVDYRLVVGYGRYDVDHLRKRNENKKKKHI